MQRCLHFLALVLTLLAWTSAGIAARADDGIFPAAPAARAAIDFDGKGFLIHGKREFIASGSMHYSRIPRALWRDRLLRIKRAGFNTVETYAFWNFHEMQEGKWDFAGDKDFNAYLKLIKELGLYAIVRVGPYVCAEWDSGGYPVWLRFKPGVRVREPNEAFEGYVDKWFDKIMPIVAANQIHKGGAVVLVQLENEHPKGWGREMPNSYFTHLRDKALSLGLEAPWFFSGLHHDHDPAGNQPWDSAGRDNPWITTEFWPGWYDIYGPLNARDERTYVRGLWKILAYGGNGYNFYMLHGGTDFETWNDDEVASNYDYGAAIGQAGDLRPIYYQFKRGNMFARSFADVLENSVNSSDKYQDMAAGTSLRVTARTSPAGTLVFLDNRGDKLVLHQGMNLQPGEIAPLVRDYKLTPNVTLTECNARVLGIARQGDMTTLVVYGYPGEGAQAEMPVLHFAASGGQQAAIVTNAYAFSQLGGDKTTLTLKPDILSDEAKDFVFAVGAQKIRVVAMPVTLADQTWFVEEGGKSYVVAGFDYVGDVAGNDRSLRVSGETFGRNELLVSLSSHVRVFGEVVQPLRFPVLPYLKFYGPALPPALGAWQTRRGDAETAVAYRDADWKTSEQPLPMGADGDTGAYAWYRATAHSNKAETLNLQFGGTGDWLAVWINGQRVGGNSDALKPRQSYTPVPRTVSVHMKAGDNAIAVLSAHYGRGKLFNHIGPIDKTDAKGLSAPVTLSKGAPAQTVVSNWTWRAASDVHSDAIPSQLGADFQTNGNGWQSLARQNQDVFNRKRGFAWFAAVLAPTLGLRHRLHFENVDDNATVYLNGHKIGAHEGWGKPFDVDIPVGVWRASRTNQLVVLVENTDNTGGIQGAASLLTPNPEDEREVRGWRMRGGIGDPESAREWRALNEKTAPANAPTFFRSEFSAPPQSETGLHPILRVTLDGLSRGFIWLNGHNLGRYPEKVPVKSLYLPECWLKPGKNTLVVFDEEGNTPQRVRLVVEEAATRAITANLAR